MLTYARVYMPIVRYAPDFDMFHFIVILIPRLRKNVARVLRHHKIEGVLRKQLRTKNQFRPRVLVILVLI